MSARFLIIGPPAQSWAERLSPLVSDQVHFDQARLPSAGIRQFEETPADLIIIADTKGGPRVETLIQAIRQRALGQLTPILLLCPLPQEDSVQNRVDDLELAGWLGPDASPEAVLALLEETLGVALKASQSPGETPQGPPQENTSYFGGDIILEPIDDAPTTTRELPRGSIFRRPPSQILAQDLSAEEIRRKLKTVRHEDYYAVLEVRRGAEGQTVREAFHKLHARFDPRKVDFELAHRFQAELDEIRDAFEDAFAVLGDPQLREPYLRHTMK